MESDDNVNDEEVDLHFQQIVNNEASQEELEEWVQTHGIISLADIPVGAASLGIILERYMMAMSHISTLIQAGADLDMPVQGDGIAIIEYPDESTRYRFEA